MAEEKKFLMLHTNFNLGLFGYVRYLAHKFRDSPRMKINNKDFL